jgi:thiaminase
MSFTEDVSKKYSAEWDKMLNHSFISELAEGRLPDEVFDFWAVQDYIFVREAIPFFEITMARLPRKYQQPFQQSLAGLENELKIFEEYGRQRNLDLTGAEPTPINHAYINFLIASAYHQDLDAVFTILYTAEKAYHEAWKRVRGGLKPGTPYEKFIENWSGDDFKQYVQWLGSELDSMTEDYPASRLDKLGNIFLMTVRYEYLFWEMAFNRLRWM